jgi:hypothetical protein
MSPVIASMGFSSAAQAAGQGYSARTNSEQTPRKKKNGHRPGNRSEQTKSDEENW